MVIDFVYIIHVTRITCLAVYLPPGVYVVS